LAFVNFGVAATWLLLQPEIHFERQSWPDVVLLIDDSLSMGGVDPYRDEKAREPVTRLAERYKRYVQEDHPAHIQALQAQLEARKTALANENRDVAADEEVIRLDRRVAALQSQLAKVNSATWKPTRLQLAQAIVLGSNPDWLTSLSKKN